MELILVRHGIPESEIAAARAGKADSERGLTPEGRSETQRVGAALKARIGRVDRILHSPYRRARETAEILAAELQVSELAAAEGFTPEDAPEAALAVLERQQVGRLLLVSHEPFLSGLLSLLLANHRRLGIGFERAGAAGVEFGGAGRSRLFFFVSPRMLIG